MIADRESFEIVSKSSERAKQHLTVGEHAPRVMNPTSCQAVSSSCVLRVWPTQVGTTPGLALRVLLSEEHVELEVAL